MLDRDKTAVLLRHAHREMVWVLLIWAGALLWTVSYCYLRGYLHEPDYTREAQRADEPGPAGKERAFVSRPQNWLVGSGLAVQRTEQNFTLVAGMPDWVFWGIFLPWVASSAATVWFCLCVMKDDDLGAEAQEEGVAHGH